MYFPIGRKPTVNFQNQYLWFKDLASCKLNDIHVKDTQDHS